jgi:hypothetical protein
MKRFLIQLSIFIVGYLLLNCLAYWTVIHPLVYKEYIQLPFDYKADTVIFGDSHAWYLTKDNQVGDSILKRYNIYNFSYGSDSYHDILFKLNFLIKNDKKPRTILLTADNHTLSIKRDKTNNLNRSVYYSDFEVYSAVRSVNFVEYFARKHLIKYLPLLDPSNSSFFVEYFKGFLRSEKKSYPDWIQRSENYRRKQAKKKSNQFFPQKHRSKKLLKSLEQIIRLCKENNIQIIAVKYPLTTEFRDAVSLNYGADSVLRSNSFQILDYSGLLSDSKFFLDEDHLNLLGTEVLLKQMIEDLG